jgi:uncharacterized repeat protein (TIGR01451 family)
VSKSNVSVTLSVIRQLLHLSNKTYAASYHLHGVTMAQPEYEAESCCQSSATNSRRIMKHSRRNRQAGSFVLACGLLTGAFALVSQPSATAQATVPLTRPTDITCPTGELKFVSPANSTPLYTIAPNQTASTGIRLDAGDRLTVTSYRSWDGYPNRGTVFQTSEQWAVRSGSQTTQLTQDLADNVVAAEVLGGSLGSIIGDGSPVTIIHSSIVPPANFDGSPNSVFPVGFCYKIEKPYDLSITKSITSTGPYAVGSDVAYSFTVTNNGPGTSSGWSMTDLVPAGLTLTTLSAPSADCSVTTASCSSSVALAAGSFVTVSGTAAIANADNLTLKNVAFVRPPNGDLPETNPLVIPSLTTNTQDSATNNDAEASLTVNAPYDLTIKKSLISSGPFVTNSTVQYLIQITNNGPSVAPGWSITDLPAAGLTVTAIAPVDAGAATCVLATLSCASTSALAAGASISVTATATLTATAPGRYRNVVYVDKSANAPAETIPLGSLPTSATDSAATSTNNDSHVDIEILAPGVTTTSTVPAVTTTTPTTVATTLPPTVAPTTVATTVPQTLGTLAPTTQIAQPTIAPASVAPPSGPGVTSPAPSTTIAPSTVAPTTVAPVVSVLGTQISAADVETLPYTGAASSKLLYFGFAMVLAGLALLMTSFQPRKRPSA